MEKNTQLPYALKVYQDADYIIRLKARFVYYLVLSAMIILGLMIPIIASLHAYGSFYDFVYLPVVIPMVVALLVFVFCYFLLVKGKYSLSANVLLISSLALVWLVLIVSSGPGIARLDTVIWLFPILAMAPMLIDKKRGLSLVYTLVNAFLLVIYLFVVRDSLGISDYEFKDFLANATIALVFLGIVSHNIFSINKAAIERAESDIQERKKSEKALRDSEAKYKDLFDTMPNGFYRSTPEGSFVDANPAFVKMLGYSSLEELKEVYIPGDIYVHESEREEVTISSEFSPELVTFRLKRKDGRVIWLEENARFIKDENGKVLYHEGICRDVSDRKKAEDALQESEADLKAIIENSMDSIWSLNNNYEIKYVNNVFAREFKRTFGVEIKKGTRLLDALPEGFRDTWKERYDRILANESLVFEDVVDSGKEKIYIEVSGNPIMLDGIVKGACFFGRNTTAKKLAEEELRQSKEMFETLFEAAPVEISLSDKQGRYILVNKTFADKLDLPVKSIIGKTAGELGVAMDDASLRTFQHELAQNGFVSDLEIISTVKEGKASYSFFNGNQITINGEKCLLSTNLDITERKKIEKELENYKNHLEKLVQDRTEELTAANEELKATNDELYEKNNLISQQKEELEKTLENVSLLQMKLIQSEKMASIGTLTAGLAHEINNPINFIANGTAAVENYISEEQPESLEELSPLFEAINAGVHRVTGIIRSMSKYNRGENFPATECNIHEIIDDGLTLLYNQYKTRIKITKNYTPQEPVVIAHEGQLHQVFLNVLANAVQSIDKEGEIHIETHKLNDRVRIVIKDNGVGIPKDQIKYIFDPFYTTKAPGKGTGLGLSISQQIITAHKGTIFCESVLNKGSSFVIELPQSKIMHD